MFAPCSANVRATSSSSRGRSQDCSAIVTRNELVAVSEPSQWTGVNRSGVRLSARTFGQSSRWMVMPRPSEM